MLLQGLQRQSGVTQMTGYPDIISRLGTTAPEGFSPFDFTDDLYADIERTTCRISPDQFDLVLVGQCKNPLEKAFSQISSCASVSVKVRERVAQHGVAPMAAISERLTASTLCPSVAGSTSGKNVALQPEYRPISPNPFPVCRQSARHHHPAQARHYAWDG